MATTVNDRDLQLAATSPRVAGVTLASNIIVPGLAGAITSSKFVELAATSQIFQIPKVGSISPTNITVTANIHNLVNTPTLTIAPGGGTMSVTPALTSGTFTFTAAQMTSDTVTLLLSLTEASITYTDTMTFVKCREGIDSINVILTNENVTLPGDSSGNVLSYVGASGNIKVYQGINDVTSVCTFALASGGNPSSLTFSLNAGPGGSGGAYAVTAGYPSGTTLTTLTFNVTFGTTVVAKVFTISKANAGAAGTNGTPGTNGTRGSVQLAIALGGSTATWSDTTAAAGVLSYTGTTPIRLDTVTEYNNSVGFTLTKFFDGSVWQTVSVAIDGNLLVTGTVGANALAANSVDTVNLKANAVTAGKISVSDLTNLVLNGKGDSAEGWTSTFTNVVAQATGATFWPTSSASVSTLIFESRDSFYGPKFPVALGDQFWCSWDTDTAGGGASTYSFSLGLVFYDTTGAITAYATGSVRSVGATGVVSLDGYLTVPANAAKAAVWVQIGGPNAVNFTGINGQEHYATNIQVRRKNNASLIVDGSITATQISATAGITAGQINANGLVIKDLSGTPILGVGTSLDNSRIVPAAGWLNSNIVVGGRNLLVDSNNFALNTFGAGSSIVSTGQTDQNGGTGATLVGLPGNTTGDCYRHTAGGFRVGTTYTCSVWVNRATASNICLVATNGTAFNTGGGTSSTASGWQRLVVQITATTTTIDLGLGGHSQTGLPAQSGGTVYVSDMQIEEGNAATQWTPATGEISNSSITVASGVLTGIGTSGVQVDNSFSLSKASASILSATVSISAAAGAGFVAGSLTWNSSGVRTAGFGVAMTPGGIIAYSSAGVNTFSLDASTGNAFFGGTLKVGVASKGSVSSSISSNITIPGSSTSIGSGTIASCVATIGTGDVLLICNLNVYLSTHTNTPYITAIDILDGTSTSLFSTSNPQPAIIGTLSNTTAGGAIQPWVVSDNFAFTILIPGGALTAGSHTFYYKVTTNFYNSTGGANTISGSNLNCGGQMSVREFIA